ncbi:MAG: PQQ-dependent sugar dehydrogenase [Chloroflexota bacterium]
MTAVDLPRYLAWASKPFRPLVDRFGMRVPRRGPRGYAARDILLPDGYIAEVVATDLSAPVMTTFGPDGAAYVVESGHKVDDPPRIKRVDLDTGETTVHHEVADDDWIRTGAVTGAAWQGGSLFMTNTDRLVRIGARGGVRTIVSGLPGRGDHQVNHPVVGPDGKLYFGVGTATNCGVVGSDNAAYAWLPKYPEVHDVPAKDVVLVGRDFGDRDVLGDLRETVQTGAFVPFGTTTTTGEVIPGATKASGAVLRCDPDGTQLEVVAWGLRNPYGLAFTDDGRLLVTEHGMDERGARFIVGDPDDLYVIDPRGPVRWFGWPDFASGVRLDDARWGSGGQGREPVLAVFPDPSPPPPVVSFGSHAAANGVAVSRGRQFGFDGQAFVALFGDLAPITTPRLSTPVGNKIVRVDLERGEIVDFAVNRIQGPASKLPHDGFERPSHVAFGPDDALYVTDFGEIDIAPEKAGIRVQAGTGSLWRIRRIAGVPAGLTPPAPTEVPFYAIQYGVWAIGLIAIIAAVLGALAAALRRRRTS